MVCGAFHKWGYPKNGGFIMLYFMENPNLKWMIWRCPYRKPPNDNVWPGWQPLDNFRRRFCHPSAWMAPRDLRMVAMVAGARAWFSSVNGFNDWIDFQYYSSLKSLKFSCAFYSSWWFPLLFAFSRPFASLMWKEFWPDFGVRLVSCKVRGSSDQLSWWLEEETGVGMICSCLS